MFTPNEENDKVPTFCRFPLRHSVVFLFWTFGTKADDRQELSEQDRLIVNTTQLSGMIATRNDVKSD